MPSANAVCHDSSELATCRHTGTAVFPAATNAAFSLRTFEMASAKIGRLLDIAMNPVLAL